MGSEAHPPESNNIEGQLRNEGVGEILENPEKFVSWYENFKNSILEWPKKFFTENTFRNAILVTAIPFAVLKAGQLNANAEGFDSAPLDVPVVSKNIESIPQRIKPNELVNLANSNDREIFARKINYELEVFDKLSKPFNDAAGSTVFDFSGSIKAKIDESNKFVNRLLAVDDPEERIRMVNDEKKRILENGQLNFVEFAKVLPEYFVANEVALLVHELGHQAEAYRQGATHSSVSIGVLSGYTEYFGEIKNQAAVDAAGISADKAYGEFVTDSLRGKDSPSQFLAIMALAAKSNGAHYSLSTKWSESRRNLRGNDIISYSNETGIPITDLAIGLTADFLLNSDNWQLLKVAFGQEGVKIPESTIALTYELGASGPVVGAKFRSIF